MTKVVDSLVFVDFGKQKNDAARKFASLVGIIEKRYHEFMDDPVKFFELAGEEIQRREAIIRDATDALRTEVTESIMTTTIPYQGIETVVVRKDEYLRLKRCANIIEGFRQ